MESFKREDAPLLGNRSVVVNNLGVTYKVATKYSPRRQRNPLTAALRWLIRGRDQRETVTALNRVSFEVYDGQSVGVLGINGSGKSTLLRMIAGQETPSTGTILARSQPVLLGISAALVPSVTGEQNALLGCLAMGMTVDDAFDTLPRIIELADIGNAIYRPMETYSSGMGARLRFAIAAASQPDILLIDEALNAGDASFKERSAEAMRELRQRAGTVFLVSHMATTIQEMCNRAIWLHKGELIADGPAESVALRYRAWTWALAKGNKEKADRLLSEVLEDRPHQGVPTAPDEVDNKEARSEQ